VAPVDNTGEPNGPQMTNIGSGFSTVCLVKGAGGKFIETTDPAYTANPFIGRWESSLDFTATSGDTTQMTNAGNQQISLSEDVSQALSLNLSHGDTSVGLYEPYRDYREGDTIALNVPGSYAMTPLQVFGITVSQTEGANYDVGADLQSLSMPMDLRLAQQASSVSGTTSPISGSIAGNLTLGSPKGLRYVALGGSYVQAVPDASTTAVSIGITACAEMTALPAAGVVAVQVVLVCAASVIGSGNYVVAYDYAGDTTITKATPAPPSTTAGVTNRSSFMVCTGGTNNRQFKYGVGRSAGTVTYYAQVIGYWMGA